MNVVRGLRPLDESEGDGAAGRVLTHGQLALLAAVQNRLIPREGALPAAGESGAAERVDRYLAERSDWRAEVLAALQAVEAAAEKVGELGGGLGETSPSAGVQGTRSPAAGGTTDFRFLDLTHDEQDAALQGVEAAQPRLFARLLRVTYPAYYADATVRRAAGFEAAPPQPGGYGLERFDASRLEAVRRRGRLWREA